MKLRLISTGLLVAGCLGALVTSYVTWNTKIETAADIREPEVIEEPLTEVAAAEETSIIGPLTSEMDPAIRDLFLEREQAGEKIQMLITGSDALASGAHGYADLLKEAMETAYGDFVDIQIISFSGTSETFTDQFIDLTKGYDVLLLEPFTLKNNGVVTIEEEREAVQKFFSSILAETPDAELILHPPQPLFGADYYLTQVAALETFASDHGYVYIDHWDAWPATDDSALKGYLTDSGAPNSRGAHVWASELIRYFTAK